MTTTSMLFDSASDSSTAEADLLSAEIGNKALGLVRLESVGVRIPHWLSLKSVFFTQWIREIEVKFPFRDLIASGRLDSIDRLRLEKAIADLQFSNAQLDALKTLSKALGESTTGFAVRSSSPYEDMESNSFAGIYDSVLGVKPRDLMQAVKECYSSLYSDKALEYIARTDLNVDSPAFSAIIQHQIDCQVSGITFSIHPVNNHYDVAYLNSNFGLGESIASGAATPDSFEVNKVSMELIASRLGDKSSRTILRDGGFIENLEVPTSNELSLDNQQVRQIVEVTKHIEGLYARPVEVEWGIAGAELFLFQARPVTRWVPLPPEMLTGSREKPILYMDRALTDGMTMNKSASHLGLDVIRGIEMSLYERYIGPINKALSAKESLLIHTGGRVYANLSIVLCMTNAKKLVKTLAPLNGQLSQILGAVNLLRYVPENKPAYLRSWKIRLLPRILWRARSTIGKIRLGIKNPAKLKESYLGDIQAFKEKLDRLDEADTSFVSYVAQVQEEIINVLAGAFTPALVVVNNGANKALDKLYPSPSEKEKVLIDNMKKGFADNLVVTMGTQIHQLGELLHDADITTVMDALDQVCNENPNQIFSDPFSSFLKEFGHRGPNEMDVAQARYKDDLEFTLSQMLAVSKTNHSASRNSAAADNQNESRNEAYDLLLAKLSGSKARKLKSIHKIYDSFGAMRDTPKHYILFGLQKIRERCLREGQSLFVQGKISEPLDIFDLTLDETSNTALDLKEEAEKNKAFRSLQNQSVIAFPSVIDSRGYIPGNDQIPSSDNNTMRGIPVSPGTVQGKVKLLMGKEPITVESTDIVVAYVTDPGLTPNFNNAAAVVLEVGGVLQHGAVVARELGIPCVTSVLGATRILKDGDHIEVNGNSGSVILLGRA